MSEYNIFDHVIEISLAEENYREYTQIMNRYVNEIEETFGVWYKAQRDINVVCRNKNEILNKTMIPIIDKGVSLLNNQDVYDIDRHILLEKYLKNAFFSFEDAIDDIKDRLEEIEDAKSEAKEYRRMRKASRGRVVGGGFGLGGALVGMAQAGALNAVSGTMHTLANSVGNTGSALLASGSKSVLYTSSKNFLLEALYDTAFDVVYAIQKVLTEKTGMQFKSVSQEEVNGANAIVNSYKAGRIPEEKKLNQIVSALRKNPFNEETYYLLWSDFGDNNNELQRMAEDFDIPLKSHKNNIANTYCRQIYDEICAEYNTAKNPYMAAINNEEDIKRALKKMEQYCNDRGLNLEDIKIASDCKELLAIIDKALCTVFGVEYKNRKEAAAVLKDRETFYSFIQERDIQDETIASEIELLEFCSDEYRENIQNIIEKERNMRDSSKVFSNIKTIISKYQLKDFKKMGGIEVARIDASFSAKEETLKTILALEAEEVPILLLDEDGTGNKGLLITNKHLWSFHKGWFSSDVKAVGIGKIRDIQCQGEKKYRVQEDDCFQIITIESEMNNANQNHLRDLLIEAIFVIQNLELLDRDQLRYKFGLQGIRCECGAYIPADKKFCGKCGTPVSKEELLDRAQLGYKFGLQGIRCECGAYIPAGKKVCSICHKAVTKDGGFVETIECPFCENRVAHGKKFCSKCGSRIEDINLVLKKLGQDVSDDSEKASLECIEQGESEVTQFCVNCGNMIKPGKKFCSKCGTPVSKKG